MASRKKKPQPKKSAAKKKPTKQAVRKKAAKKKPQRKKKSARRAAVVRSVYGIRSRGDVSVVLHSRDDVHPWERFVHALQAISSRPVALRIREWSETYGVPVWEIITPEVEFTSGTRIYTPPISRGVGPTPQEAVEDFMAFAAEAFARSHVLAVFCRDTERGNYWAYYRWHEASKQFLSCPKPESDPEPSRHALL